MSLSHAVDTVLSPFKGNKQYPTACNDSLSAIINNHIREKRNTTIKTRIEPYLCSLKPVTFMDTNFFFQTINIVGSIS